MSTPDPRPAGADVRAMPWLACAVDQLCRARAAGRFPGGLLIHDERGAGGPILARFAAQLAFCRAAGGIEAPCGRCRDCAQFARGTHPDFMEVMPLEDSRIIRVEQIRELCEQLALTAHGGGAVVALIRPADTMNPNAANALLKTLEEPRAGTTLILVSAEPSRLPATVLSRCQRLRVGTPRRAQSLAWLRQHRGPGPWEQVLDVLGEAPIEAAAFDPAELARLKLETERALEEALAGHMDIGGTAERWVRAPGFELRLACYENWLTKRIEDACTANGQSRELRSGAHLPATPSAMNTALLLRLLDGAYELRRLRLTSINRALALEQLLWPLPRTRMPARAAGR